MTLEHSIRVVIKYRPSIIKNDKFSEFLLLKNKGAFRFFVKRKEVKNI
jgi:hypothetical protein